MLRWLPALCCLGASGCGLLLDFDPPDLHPDTSVFNPDASMSDSGTLDGDLGFDGDLPDGFSADANANLDGSEAGLDGSLDASPDAGTRRCEDTTEGYCFRFENLAGSPEVTGWMIQFIWTLPGGLIYRLPDNRDPDGVSVYQLACIVFRRIDATTTECEINVPDPGMPTIGAGPFFAYPTYASGPACTSTGCPNYPAGYRMWSGGVEFSTAPADGRVSLESRPTPAGTGIVIRLIP